MKSIGPLYRSQPLTQSVLVLFALLSAVSVTLAGSHSSISSFGSGGTSTTANYVNNSALGEITGVSTAAQSETLRAGYIAQLSEAVAFNISVPSTNLSEGASLQLTVTEQLDDGTISTAADWIAITGPIASITPNGIIAAANVYQDTPATIRGSSDGLTQLINLTIKDTGTDDYGLYARDGIPDAWQMKYFGDNNPQGAASADADQTSQNNLFKYIAGLNPTNPASRFDFQIAAKSATQTKLIFGPYLPDRTYTLEYKTDLNALSFTALSNALQTLNGSTMSVMDTDTNSSARFYRVNISYP